MSKKTVFVVGAGASTEVGLPDGRRLKDSIVRHLDYGDLGMAFKDNFGIYAALDEHVRELQDPKVNIGTFRREADFIRSQLHQARSIDDFIESHRENKKQTICAKLAIATSILEAEEKSNMSLALRDGQYVLDTRTLHDTWYEPFSQHIRGSASKSELKDRFRLITLIIFNYDRCIEHYLFHAISNYFELSDRKEVVDIIDCLNIYHPYGSVGSPYSVGYGSRALTPSQLLATAEQIKTYTEGVDPKSSDIVAIREKVAETDRLAFLGFAFHDQNIDLIMPTNHTKNPACFATVRGMSDYNAGKISEILRGRLNCHPAPAMTDKPCAEFFSEFSMGLFD